jgi:hypothetical protein
MKKLIMKLSLALLVLSSFSAFSQNPKVVNGVATFWENKTVGCPFMVPDSWNKIIIGANVTVKGNFVIEGDKRDFVIEGADWMTSILDNSATEYKKGGDFRNFCNVRFQNQGSLLLKNFTSLNPANFHITAWAPLTLDRMRVIDNRGQNSTDAAHSTKGVTILNSYISTYDDVLYVGECKYIYNTTIMHNRNGAPFMISWGGNADGSYTKAEKVTIIDNETNNTGYAHGVVGWAQEDVSAGLQTVTIEFIDCIWKTAAGKVKCNEFYSFGNNGNSVTNVKVIQKGGDCDWTSPIRLRNNSSNCNVVCETSTYSLTVNSGTGSGNLLAASTKTITANAAPTGKEFDKWVVNSGTPTIANANAASTLLTMPKGNVIVTATYKDIVVDITPTDITNLLATAISCNSVKLTWGDVQGEEAYRVRRKTPTSDYIVLTDLPANAISYVDTTADEKTTYQYMVRPMKGGVAVAVSNTPQILTEACITDPIPVDTYLKAYPNPTTGLITLPEVFAKDQIKVGNQLSGKTILTKTIQQNGSTELDITNQPAGNYIIQIIRNNQLLTRLIIKL